MPIMLHVNDLCVMVAVRAMLDRDNEARGFNRPMACNMDDNMEAIIKRYITNNYS